MRLRICTAPVGDELPYEKRILHHEVGSLVATVTDNGGEWTKKEVDERARRLVDRWNAYEEKLGAAPRTEPAERRDHGENIRILEHVTSLLNWMSGRADIGYEELEELAMRVACQALESIAGDISK